MTLTCPKCASNNRLPSIPNARVRCGNCKYEFKPADLVKAKPEGPPPPPRFALEVEDDIDLEAQEEEDEW